MNFEQYLGENDYVSCTLDFGYKMINICRTDTDKTISQLIYEISVEADAISKNNSYTYFNSKATSIRIEVGCYNDEVANN